MKKIKILLLATVMAATLTQTKAQDQELAQLALNIEKLAQFKQILTDLKNGYQILSNGYGTIKDIAQGNFKIHQVFLDGLYLVSPTVRKYRRVAEIIQYQIVLVEQYKLAWSRFRRMDVFNADELRYLAGVYQRLFEASLRNLEELTMIITSGQLRMSDDERLQAIDAIYADMEDKVIFLRAFNNQTSLLGLGREKQRSDIRLSERINGTKK